MSRTPRVTLSAALGHWGRACGQLMGNSRLFSISVPSVRVLRAPQDRGRCYGQWVKQQRRPCGGHSAVGWEMLGLENAKTYSCS